MHRKSRETLADNVGRLIDQHAEAAGRRSVRGWASAKKVDAMLAQRVATASNAVTLDKLDQVAEKIGLEPWQLLFPDLDPVYPPVLPRMSAEALDVARIIDSITDEGRRRKAYALIVQAIELGNVEQPSQPEPSETPTRKPVRPT